MIANLLVIPKHGVSKPTLMCRYCSCPVEKADESLLCWHADRTGEPWIACEDCDSANDEEEPTCSTIQLDHAILMLFVNCGGNLKESLKMMQSMREAGMFK